MRRPKSFALVVLLVLIPVAVGFHDSARIKESLAVEGISLGSTRAELTSSDWKLAESSERNVPEQIFTKRNASLGIVFKDNKATILEGKVLATNGTVVKAGALRKEVRTLLGEPDSILESQIDGTPVEYFEYRNKLGFHVASLELIYDDEGKVRNFSIHSK